MTKFGYTLMCEQTPPKQLVGDAVAAEEAGFDYAVISDHYFPWLTEMGHSPYAWSVLGAVANATDRLPLMTYVTCPIMRYHPAVVAQKAATVAALSGDRFTLGLGAGENLNEHVVGQGWPPVDQRHEMFTEAVDIIRDLLAGGYVTYHGEYFTVDSAKLWDLPSAPVPIALAASGRRSGRIAARNGDGMIAIAPDADLVSGFVADAGADKPVYGQVAVSYDTDYAAALERARRLWRWAPTGWHVMAELPSPVNFEAATRFVTADDVAELVPCGDDVDRHVDAVRPFVEAGFSHVALVQVGADRQAEFMKWAAERLLPALRKL